MSARGCLEVLPEEAREWDESLEGGGDETIVFLYVSYTFRL